MQYDIVIILGRHHESLDGCLASIMQACPDGLELDVTVMDNLPNATAPLIPHHKGFGCFHLLRCPRHCSGQQATLSAAKAGHAPWVLLLSPTATLMPDFFYHLDEAVARFPEAAGFECRQLPLDTVHHVDPVTLEIPFATGDAVVYSREVFMRLGGYQRRIPFPGCDIDLGRRILAEGGRLFQLPKACVMVNSPPPTGDEERLCYQNTEYSRLLLSYRYGSFKDIAAANHSYFATLKNPRHFEGIRKGLAKGYLRHLLTLWGMVASRKPLTQPNWDFSFNRGSHPLPAPVCTGPKISVVIRTHKRPYQLAAALQSVANQSYSNYEVVVVEDGAPTAEALVQEQFSHLPLRYHATGQPVGRGRAGNIGLEMATGEYLNFLDDDDCFYPDHLEQMAASAIGHPEADLILGCSVAMMAAPAKDGQATPDITGLSLIRFDRLDVFTMCQMCQIPLLSGMFKKQLFLQLGGLDETMDGHEDWAMWLKFLSKARRINKTQIDIPRATSVFVQPASETEASARIRQYMAFDEQLFNDEAIRFNLTIGDLRRFYDDMLADIRHVQALGQLEDFLQREENREKER